MCLYCGKVQISNMNECYLTGKKENHLGKIHFEKHAK